MLLRTFHLGDKLIFKSLLGINKYKFNNNKFKYIIKYLNYYIFYNYILKYLNIIRFNIIYFNKYNIYNIFNLSIIKFNYLLINKILNNLWIITYLYNYLYKLNNNIYINNINKKNYLLF
ncbi:hypothetical protein BgAZ_600030 (apicoplast) [Babesia gibsoni]|uniref:Uncharacterized protein n=1 Tax=Babesia gibsoni TaxID=33632 RepID=A0AAD8LFJ0_BABGI|nr:hypothetical protein BgAZ_600030 [Babesia gibsoni]